MYFSPARFKVLGDETRFRILDLLMGHDLCVGALARRLKVSEAAISQHLQILRKAGLVQGEKRGYWTHYTVQTDTLAQIADDLKAMADREPASEGACFRASPEKEKQIGEKLAEASKETEREMSLIGKCPICDGNLVIKRGKFGRFIACDNYPKCSITFKLPGGALIKPTKKICEKCSYPMIQVIRRGKRPQEVCINPECETKKIEDKEARKEAEKVEAGKIEKKCPKCGKKFRKDNKD